MDEVKFTDELSELALQLRHLLVYNAQVNEAQYIMNVGAAIYDVQSRLDLLRNKYIDKEKAIDLLRNKVQDLEKLVEKGKKLAGYDIIDVPRNLTAYRSLVNEILEEKDDEN